VSRRGRWLLGAAVAAAALAGLFLLRGAREPEAPEPDLAPLTSAEKRELESLARRAESLEWAIRSRRPRGTYLVIDTGRNLLTLHEDGRPPRSAVCSTGSGRALEDPASNRRWVFDTPRGEFFVRNKWPNPVWIKPDWAFLEIGEPIPRSLAERLAPAELGDYAMDLGDGYLIHGTLYQRALGLSITHGCVRLGDDDLEAIYRKVRVGTAVYIF
jgi:L,D-transpeptidase YbiS